MASVEIDRFRDLKNIQGLAEQREVWDEVEGTRDHTRDQVEGTRDRTRDQVTEVVYQEGTYGTPEHQEKNKDRGPVGFGI